MTTKTISARLSKIQDNLRDMRRQEATFYSFVMPKRRERLPSELSLDVVKTLVVEFLYTIFSFTRMVVVLWLDIPTAFCFMHEYLDLILVLLELNGNEEAEDIDEIKEDLHMAANYFLQDIVIHSWSDAPPSLVAYAALLVSLEDYAGDQLPTPQPKNEPANRRSIMRSAIQKSFRSIMGGQTPDSDTMGRRLYFKSSIQKSLRSLNDHEEFNLQKAFVKNIRRMTGVDSSAPGLYDLIILMSDSSTAASLCLAHAQSYEKQ